MPQYITPILPAGGVVNERAVEFFDAFYKLSDNPKAIEDYANMFLSDAAFIFAQTTSVGSDQILAFRRGMWATIAKRHHSVLKIFPFGAGSNDFMLYGEADFVSTTGQESAKQWAAHAELAEDASGELKFKLYHVYVDTAPAPTEP